MHSENATGALSSLLSLLQKAQRFGIVEELHVEAVSPLDSGRDDIVIGEWLTPLCPLATTGCPHHSVTLISTNSLLIKKIRSHFKMLKMRKQNSALRHCLKMNQCNAYALHCAHCLMEIVRFGVLAKSADEHNLTHSSTNHTSKCWRIVNKASSRHWTHKLCPKCKMVAYCSETCHEQGHQLHDSYCGKHFHGLFEIWQQSLREKIGIARFEKNIPKWDHSTFEKSSLQSWEKVMQTLWWFKQHQFEHLTQIYSMLFTLVSFIREQVGMQSFDQPRAVTLFLLGCTSDYEVSWKDTLKHLPQFFPTTHFNFHFVGDKVSFPSSSEDIEKLHERLFLRYHEATFQDISSSLIKEAKDNADPLILAFMFHPGLYIPYYHWSVAVDHLQKNRIPFSFTCFDHADLHLNRLWLAERQITHWSCENSFRSLLTHQKPPDSHQIHTSNWFRVTVNSGQKSFHEWTTDTQRHMAE